MKTETLSFSIEPLTRARTEELLDVLLEMDRGTKGEPWASSHFLFEVPEKWKWSRLATSRDGQVVGFLFASRKSDVVHVHRMAIAEAFRSQGVGSALLRSLVNDARNQGFSRVTMKVAPQNTRALRLYERLGFHIVEREPANLILCAQTSDFTLPAASEAPDSAPRKGTMMQDGKAFTVEGKTIIAIAPHIDDVELGAGATIHHLSKKNTVYYVGLSLPPLVSREVFMPEFQQSTKRLGIDPRRITLRDYNPRNLFDSRSEILQLFYDLNKQLKPQIVFLPNSKDIHQSHEVVYAEGRRAFKYGTILGYELPWNSMEFPMDVFVTVTKEDVDAKIAAINAYKTQTHRMFFSNDIVGDLARVRGKQIGHEYAECFELIRLIL